MKTNHYLFIALAALAASCSNDDNNNNGNNNPDGNGSYIPSEQGNYWVYDVENDMLDGRDSVYIANDTIINSLTYTKIKTKNQPLGFFSNALNNNAIRHADGKTYLTGTAALGFAEELPLDLSLNDFIVFDDNASDNQTLSSINGTLNQQMEGFDISFKYTLSSKSKATVTSVPAGAETYSNVKPVEITLNLEINITVQIDGFPIPVTYPLLPAQNVLVSTQYYAQGIGAVKSVTEMNYQLSQIPGMELPIPQSGQQHITEILAKYNLD